MCARGVRIMKNLAIISYRCVIATRLLAAARAETKKKRLMASAVAARMAAASWYIAGAEKDKPILYAL